MDILFDNPLARMYGPAFLLCEFILYLLAVLFVRFLLMRYIIPEKDYLPLLVPVQPNPYEIAYLSGGEGDVLALGLYSVTAKKYFKIDITKTKHRSTIMIRQSDPNLNYGNLPGLEKSIYKSLTGTETLSSFVAKRGLKAEISEYTKEIRSALEEQDYFLAGSVKKRFIKFKRIIQLSILGLVSYKLIAALLHGHTNVLGLILFAVIGTIALEKVEAFSERTKKVKDYLGKLRQAFPPPQKGIRDTDPLYMKQVLLALHGPSVLANSEYRFVASYFSGSYVSGLIADHNNRILEEQRRASGNSSCSGGSGCGGSCGGGCGGCGGCS